MVVESIQNCIVVSDTIHKSPVEPERHAKRVTKLPTPLQGCLLILLSDATFIPTIAVIVTAIEILLCIVVTTHIIVTKV
jgi:hypothetical protein